MYGSEEQHLQLPAGLCGGSWNYIQRVQRQISGLEGKILEYYLQIHEILIHRFRFECLNVNCVR